MRALVVVLFWFGCGAPAPSVDLGDDLGPADLAVGELVYPQLVNHGGPVVAAMEIWTAVWGGDETLGDQLNGFYRDMFGTDYYWTGILGQYGVGKGRAMGKIVIPGPKPVTLAHDDIPVLAATLAAQLPGGVNSNSVVDIVIPTSTTLTGISDKIVGYHNHTSGGVPFIVLTQRRANLGTPFDDLTYFASHEAAEVATNPTSPAAWYDDALGSGAGEIADVCNPLAALIYAIGDGGVAPTYLVSRLYHNLAASQGHDSCWQYPKGAPYFNMSVEPRQVALTAGIGTTTLHLFSTGDVGDIVWSIEGIPAGVSVTPSGGTNRVGDSVDIRITARSGADIPLAVYSSSAKTTYSNVWWFVVKP